MLPFSIISNTDIPLRPKINGNGVSVPESSVIGFTYGIRSVMIGDIMYYLPGYNNSSYNGSGGFYSYNMNTGQRIQLSSLPQVIVLPWISVHNGDIYIGAGRITNATSGAWNTTVYKYTVSTDTWSAVGSNLNNAYTSGTTVGDKIYSARPNAIDVYDISTGTTSSFSCPFGSAGVSAYTAYSYITSNGTDTLYVNSTINPTTKPVSYFYSYNLNTSSWTNLGFPESQSRPGPMVYSNEDGFVYVRSIEGNFVAYNSGYTYVIPVSSPPASRRDFTTLMQHSTGLYLVSVNDSTFVMIKFT